MAKQINVNTSPKKLNFSFNFSLKNEPILEDFPLNSLIVFDIVQPQLSKLRRVLTFVVSTGKDIPIVGTDKQEVNDDGYDY